MFMEFPSGVWFLGRKCLIGVCPGYSCSVFSISLEIGGLMKNLLFVVVAGVLI